MTLYNLIDKLKMLALKHPNIGSAEEGSIYDIMNSSKEHKYATVVITQGTHSDDETYDYYNLNLFYVDRLVSDMDSNRLEIQSLGKSMLQNIIKAFVDEFDAECDRIEYHPFTERFADECSGVYATLTISIVKDYNCSERYWDESYVAPIVTIRNQSKNVEYTENGTYLVEYDADKYSGLEKVEITVNVPDTNGSYDDGYDNGYEEGYNEGHEEGEELGIAVQKQKLTSLSVTKNGTYNREDGYNSVDVNIDIKKVVIPNGLSFYGSTFSELPINEYDWSTIRDTTVMFAECPNLNVEPIINALNDGTIPSKSTPFMFYKDSVKKIEGIDFTKYVNCECMFYELTDLEEVKNCVFPYYTHSYSLISCTNRYHRLIDCDFSNVNASKPWIIDSNWYFGKFQNVDNFTSLVYSGSVNGRVCVMECDKPSTLKVASVDNVWYDATKYSGWDDTDYECHPYGFWYNVITKNDKVDIKITQENTETKFDFEQVVPYNEEKGCYYIDYPYYMRFDVHVNGKRIEQLSDRYNLDLYVPNTEVGVYEGVDIKNLLYYDFNSEYFEINENGLRALASSSTKLQRIATPTNTMIITATYGSYWLYITKNGERVRYKLDEKNDIEHIIDTSDCDYVDVEMYIQPQYLDKTYIKKIEMV